MTPGFPCLRTQDGVVIVHDPKTGAAASGLTAAAAVAELRRLIAARRANR